MINTLKNTFNKLLKDRLLLFGMVVLLIAGLTFSGYMIANAHQYDQLIYTRYTIYGEEHYYRDRWFYRLAISGFGIIVALMHNVIITKLYESSGKKIAYIFLAYSFIVIAIGFFVMSTVLREIPN